MPTVPPAERQGATRVCREPSLRILRPGSQPSMTSNKSLNFPKPSSWALKKVGVKSGTLTVSPLTDSPRKKENCQKWAELESGPEVLHARTHAHIHTHARTHTLLVGRQASDAGELSSGDQGPGEAGVERSSHEYP